MKRAIALAIAVLALSTCSSGHPTATPGVTHRAVTSQPANPVPILRETGAQIPAGEVYGSRDINGDLYASGNSYGPGCTAASGCSEQVTVRTVAPGTLAQVMTENADAGPSDSNAVNIGHNFYVTLTPVASINSSSAYTWFVSAATVAACVDGRVLTPGS